MKFALSDIEYIRQFKLSHAKSFKPNSFSTKRTQWLKTTVPVEILPTKQVKYSNKFHIQTTEIPTVESVLNFKSKKIAPIHFSKTPVH